MPENLSPRILIIRLSAFGDAIHGLPVLNALRRALPNAYLGWLVEGRTGTLLEGHDALDALIRVPRKWLKSPSTVWNLRRNLRELEFDTTIDVQGLSKSAIAAWLSGARRRIGFAGEDGREMSQILNNQVVAPQATHVIDRNLELLRPLGIEQPQVEFCLPQHAHDSAKVEQHLSRVGLVGDFVVLNPGAGWPSKLWPTERFAVVAQHLKATHGLTSIVVWAGEEEHRMAHQIVQSSHGSAQLAPSTTLTELGALLRRARLMVSSDTGPLHLSVAVGTPSIGLFGPMPHERNGPYGPQHISIQSARLEGSSRERRTADNSTMKAITAVKVCLACDQMLGRKLQAAA